MIKSQDLHKRLAKLHILRAIKNKASEDIELKLAIFHCKQARLDIFDLMEEDNV